MAPRLVDRIRLQGHAGQPRPCALVLRVTQMISPDELLGQWVLATAIIELLVRCEILQELRRGDLAVIAQEHLAERIALLVPDVPWHVDAQEQAIAGIDSRD